MSKTLPPRNVFIVNCELTEFQKKEYKDEAHIIFEKLNEQFPNEFSIENIVNDESKENIDEEESKRKRIKTNNNKHVLSMLLKLRQICNVAFIAESNENNNKSDMEMILERSSKLKV